MVNKQIFKLNILLFCLVPIALITGPFLPDLFISILGLSTIYFLFSNEFNFRLLKNHITIFLFVFYFYLLIISFFSDNILLSLESSLFYFRFIFFHYVFFIYYFIFQNLNTIFFVFYFYLLLWFLLMVS